jgi:alpha-L-fucosidase
MTYLPRASRLHLAIPFVALATCGAPLLGASEAVAQTRYTASWTSLDTHNPAPEWFQDGKFGIYFHWGAFATPMFGTEWYPRNMMNKAGNSAEYQHHMATYGDPYGDWGYDKFLTGGKDKAGNTVQFAPKLKSAGGNWDPDEWAQMFLDAGARFAGPVAEHHDGFSMWDSKVNEWNSVAMGPKLNLAKLHADAIRKKGLRVFMSLHTEWNFGGYWAYGTPTTSDPSLQKLYGKLSNADEQALWLGELKEVIDEFLPDILYQDRYLSGISQTNLMTFLAYYYNAALDANKEVVAVAKETITDHKGQLYDYERGGPADIRTPYWMTDDSVGSQSWCYVSGLSYYSDAQFIGAFVDRVSKGGNMILNTSPMPDGSFPQRQKDILAAFGKFLKQMGTAIYNTRAFAVYGEGPTKMGGGEFTSPTALTSTDIRYTKSKDGDAVYALLGGWPGNGKQVNMTAVTTSRFDLGSGKVFLFGPSGDGTGEITLQATQDGAGVHVTLPSTQPYTALAYAIKLSKSGTAPAATPWITSAPSADAGVPTDGSRPDAGSDGSVGAGGSMGTGGSTSGSATGGTSGVGGANAAGGTGGGGTSGSTAAGGNGAGGSAINGGSGGRAGSSGSGSGGVSGAGGGGGLGGHQSSGQGGTSPAPIASSSSGCTCAIRDNGKSSGAGAWFLLGLVTTVLFSRRLRKERRHQGADRHPASTLQAAPPANQRQERESDEQEPCAAAFSPVSLNRTGATGRCLAA